MAEKGWTSQAATAAGTAAGTGAAQLGLGYGLGVLVWPVTATGAGSLWLGSLGWATWVTASATVLGAVIAGRLRPDRPGRWRVLWRFALAAASALGALVPVVLVALPARAAVPLNTLPPQLVAGGYALAGLLAGLIVAFWAVSSGPVAANLIGTAMWLWALAVAGVGAELVTGRDFATYLTSWQFAESVNPIRYGGIYWPSALLTLAAAFVIGLIAAWPAGRRGEIGLGTAISGAVGPLLVAFSFLILAPRLTAATGPLQSAYLIAPYAVLAGLAGSALTTAIGQNRRPHRAGLVPAAPPGDSGAEPGAGGGPELGDDPVSKFESGRGSATPGGETESGRGNASGRGTAEDPGTEGERGTGTGRGTEGEPGPGTGRGTGTGREELAPADRERRPVPPRQPGRGEPTAVSAPLPAPAPIGPPPSAPAGSPTAPATAPAPPRVIPASPPAPRTGRVTGAPASAPGDRPTAYIDPEIAEAARPSRNPAKRGTGRKGGNGKPEGPSRSTITPPPPNPTIAKINPTEGGKP